MVRVRIDLGYDGTDFSGWATQPGRRTVQATVEAAVGRVLRHDVSLAVAGRTDAGVHATGQVAHADLPARVWAGAPDRLVRRLAGVLPGDIRIGAMQPAPDGFDARFAALWRRYRYRICDDDAGPSPLQRRRTLHWRRPVNVGLMQQAATELLGEHDFAAFCRQRERATTWRALQAMTVRRRGTTVAVTVRADAFCHSMVRSLVGALLAVGDGRRPVDWPASLLGARERAGAVVVAPAHGLTLVRVGYPADDALATRQQQTRRRRFDWRSP